MTWTIPTNFQITQPCRSLQEGSELGNFEPDLFLKRKSIKMTIDLKILLGLFTFKFNLH
jgi:hypothetical protein